MNAEGLQVRGANEPIQLVDAVSSCFGEIFANMWMSDH